MTIQSASQAPSRSTATGPAAPSDQSAPSPALLFDTITAYQKTAAIKAGIELDVFTAMAERPATVEAIATHCSASPRGIRILCDYLVLLGFLTKSAAGYALTPDSAVFLNRKSPAYAGGTLEFLHSTDLRGMFDQLTASTRQGGTVQTKNGTMEVNHPVWLSFARVMGSLMIPAAAGLAELVKLDRSRPTRVLDVSASHGAWGLAFANKYPQSHLVALDWAPVLEITQANARAAGITDRFSAIAGSAFDVEFGRDYDVILVPNFLHHFSPAECVQFLKKTQAALRPGGAIAIVEFVPNPDRVTPPAAAGFSLVMLATTAHGDAYTLAEYADMLAQAGFNPPTQHSLPASMNAAVIATR